MFQDMISKHIKISDKSTSGGSSVAVTQSGFGVNDVVDRVSVSGGTGIGYQFVVDVDTSSSNILVSIDVSIFYDTSDPSTENLACWIRTVESAAAAGPSNITTGTNSHWLPISRIDYVDGSRRYLRLTDRVLVPNRQQILEPDERQFVQVAIFSASGEAMNASGMFNLRAHTEEYQFLQPMK